MVSQPYLKIDKSKSDEQKVFLSFSYILKIT